MIGWARKHSCALVWLLPCTWRRSQGKQKTQTATQAVERKVAIRTVRFSAIQMWKWQFNPDEGAHVYKRY